MLLALHFGANTLIILVQIFVVVGLGMPLDLKPGEKLSRGAVALALVVMLLFGWLTLLAYLISEARSEP
jgi:hypothetical protein